MNEFPPVLNILHHIRAKLLILADNVRRTNKWESAPARTTQQALLHSGTTGFKFKYTKMMGKNSLVRQDGYADSKNPLLYLSPCSSH